MGKKLFVICADISAVMVSNGKNAVLRLGSELVRQGCEVQVLFSINKQPHIISPFTNLFNKTFDDFRKTEVEADPGQLYLRFNRIRYAQSRLAVYGLQPVVDLNALKNRDYVVIYPETFSVNPLNAKNVIRYYGFKPGVLNDHESDTAKYSDDEFKLAASKNLMAEADFTLFDPYIDGLFIKKTMVDWDERSISLVYRGKNKKFISHPIDCNKIEISRDWPDRVTLAELLHRSKYFFTYDSYSIINIEAILAGAIPIFCDNWLMTDDELDSGELGYIPRFSISDFLNNRVKITKFENERKKIINRLIVLQENWPMEVARLVEKVSQKFCL